MSKIARIDKKSLMMILDGKIVSNHSVVIKMYAPHCKYCHNLAKYYKDLSIQYEDIQFFAFNMDDDGDDLEEKYGFYGIPTFFHVKTDGKKTKVALLGDPQDPHDHTWYRVSDIKAFIDTHK